MDARPIISSFNRGMISKLGLARVAEEDKVSGRVRLSAEKQVNYIPRVLGSMMLRPGLKYTGATASNNQAVYVPFTFATDDLADLEFTDGAMRVWIDDALVTRASVSSVFTNGAFDSDVSSWTNADDAGATSSWATGGYLSMLGTGFASARRRQTVSVASGDQNVLHGIRLVIERGTVTIRVGTTTGGSEYFERTLGEGEYSLAFTPTADFEVELSSSTKYASLVNSIAIDGSGNLSLTSPYAGADIGLIRWIQSADVIFLACDGYQQYKIERYGTTSWGIVKYWSDDGPFRVQNLTKTTLTPSAISGDITLTSDNPVFTSESVGALYRIGSIGQYVEVSVTAENEWSDAISVSGVDNTRIITINISNTWSGTVTLQRSSDEGSTWAEVATYTSNQTNLSYDDGLDNQDLQYRIGIDTGDYTSGTADCTLTYSTGSLTGYVRVTAFTDTSTVSAIVLKELGGTSASSDWSEGEWSARRGYPTCVTIYESRVCWFGRGKFQSSESDAYYDFDPSTVGDAGPINRSIGSGPVDVGNWMFSGSRLVIATDGGEVVTRQSFDELMTPSNFGFKYPSRIGSARVHHGEIDGMPVFVQRGGTKLYRLAYDSSSYDYVNSDMMELVPEIGEPSIVRVAVQRQPDTRVHCVRSDGKVALMVSDFAEEVSCFILIQTNGFIEDAYVQPGTTEDQVYYIVKRTINGSTVRYREKFALENECQGGTLNKQADSFIVYDGASTSTITGLSHLEGEEVVVWSGGATIASKTVSDGQVTGLTSYIGQALIVRNAADDGDYGLFEVNEDGAIDDLEFLEGSTVTIRYPGKYLGDFTVSSGAITLSEAVTECVVGLTYRARYKSVKLAYGAQGGTALTQVKRIDHIAPILHKTHYQGLKYGRNFSNLYNLPDVYKGRAVNTDEVFLDYDQIPFGFEGEYNTDSRICLQSDAPKPCTLLGLVMKIQTNEG